MKEEILKEKINKLFYGFLKEARRSDFSEFLEDWELSFDDFDEIREYFKKQGITL